MLTIQRVTGISLDTYIPDLARLRIEIFRDYPYLYDGDLDYEAKYLQTYIQAPHSVIVIAFDDNQVVGDATAIPLRHETPEVIKPFLEHGFQPDQVFYVGELVLQKPYRGQGIGVTFLGEIEAHARQVGPFTWLTLCAVERPLQHPLRSKDYVPLDNFWKHRGYIKHPELQTTFSWKEISESAPSPKPMTFWLKVAQ